MRSSVPYIHLLYNRFSNNGQQLQFFIFEWLSNLVRKTDFRGNEALVLCLIYLNLERNAPWESCSRLALEFSFRRFSAHDVVCQSKDGVDSCCVRCLKFLKIISKCDIGL